MIVQLFDEPSSFDEGDEYFFADPFCVLCEHEITYYYSYGVARHHSKSIDVLYPD